MTEAYDGRQVVGMDLHRRRSVLVRMTEDGRKLETVRITNSPAALRAVIARAGEHPRVVIEATYGWYWAVDVIEAAGRRCTWRTRWASRIQLRRVKNERDAADLADLLRMGRLPEAWIAPAGDPRAARADPLPASARQGAHLGQRSGARGAGQARHPGHPYRHFRRDPGRRGWMSSPCRSRMRARSPRCGSWPAGSPPGSGCWSRYWAT
jgi:hypothetical protein